MFYCPDPDSVTSSGLVGSESVIRSVALRVPLALGANLTLMVQLLPEAWLVPQVLVCVKSAELVPVNEMELMVRVAGPTFVRVTVWAALVVPTVWAEKLKLVGLKVTIVPVPLSATVCGLPKALSLKVRLAVRVPATDGRKVTLTVQEDPAVSVVPHEFDGIAKSAALAPVILMLLMLRVAVPVFLSVTVCAEDVVKFTVTGNVIEVGEGDAIGPVPLPVSETAWGLPAALSVKRRLPLLVPVAVGLNVTLTVQVALMASEEGQLLVCAKSPGLVPAIVMLESDRAAVPVFFSVTGCEALVLPTANEANVSEVGVSCTTGATAMEVKFTPDTLPLFTVTL